MKPRPRLCEKHTRKSLMTTTTSAFLQGKVSLIFYYQCNVSVKNTVELTQECIYLQWPPGGDSPAPIEVY